MDPKLSYSLAKFAFNFCNELTTSRTTICSPLSAELLLAMLALGCKGQSRAELMHALDIPDDDALRSSFAFVTSSLQSIERVTLNMGTKVYLKKGNGLKAGIKKDVEEVFQTSMEQLDFLKKDAAAGVINTWVEEKTNGLIKDIVQAKNFNEKSRLVLVNAIYFKGNWQVPFSVKWTENRNFHVDNTTTIQVPTMYRGDVRMKFRVIPQLKAKILEMDYECKEASMVIVLPDEIEGLNSVLQLLAGGHDLMANVKALKFTKVNVMIPKFRVEMTIDLKNLLPKLGINTILEEDTSVIDLLTSGERLVVSEAVQKVFIVVDETGTEAAAATTILCRKRFVGMERRPQCFIADRPFLYLLMVRGIPLLVGVYEGSQFRVPPSTG